MRRIFRVLTVAAFVAAMMVGTAPAQAQTTQPTCPEGYVYIPNPYPGNDANFICGATDNSGSATCPAGYEYQVVTEENGQWAACLPVAPNLPGQAGSNANPHAYPGLDKASAATAGTLRLRAATGRAGV